MSHLLYKEEVYAIVGAAMEVYNQLGSGFLEAVYQEALAIELESHSIPFQEQQPITITYKGRPLRQRYIPDFIVYSAIIVEIKAIQQLGSGEQAQLLNYLKATGYSVGVLVNFGSTSGKLEWKRMVQTPHSVD